MMKESLLRSSASRTGTAWVLIAIFLLQPLITYFASPWFSDNGHGRLVVICTLYGLEERYIEDGLQSIEKEADSCPAIKLIQMSGTAYPTAELDIASAVLYSVGAIDQTSTHQHHSLHYSAYHTRAPPLV